MKEDFFELVTTLVQQYSQPAGLLRRAGVSYAEIARQLNISLSTAYRAAQPAAARPAAARPNTKTPAATERAAIKLRAKGKTYTQIAAQLKIPSGTAWRLCNRDRAREIFRASTARYRARGRCAICSIEPSSVWLAMNRCDV